MIARRMKALNVRKIAHFREQRATMNFKQLLLKVNFLRNSNQNVLHPLATLPKESCVLQINECVYTRLVTPSSPIYYNICISQRSPRSFFKQNFTNTNAVQSHLSRANFHLDALD